MSQKRGAESQVKNAKPKRARFSEEVQTLEFDKKGDTASICLPNPSIVCVDRTAALPETTVE